LKYARPVLFLTMLLALCGFSLYSSYLEVKTKAIVQLNERQMTHARQAARSIQDYFESYLYQLKNLAVSEHIVQLDESGEELMGLFYLSHWEQITTVSRVDEKGTMIYVVPQSGGGFGTDISWREPIQQVMKTHQPVISDLITSIFGFQTVVCHVPVFERGVYRGTLGISVPFNYIAKKYLDEIKIGDDGYAWLISQKGIELYCPVPGHVGTSVFENCRDFPSILVMVDGMTKGETGSTTYQYDGIRGETVATQTKHAVYMAIPLANTFWSIAVATPEKEVLANIEGFRNRWLLTMVAMLFFGALGATYLLRAVVIIEEEEKRKQTEVALRKSEALYRAMVEDQSELITRFSPDLSLLFVNEAYCRYFGEEREKLLKEGFMHHVPPAERERLQAHLASLGVSNPAARIEHQVVAAGGEIHWMQWIDHAFFDGAGNLLEIQAVGRDITEQKRAEEELRAAHRSLSEIIDFLPDPTFVIDSKGQVIAWNRAIEEMTGVEAKAILGKGNYEYALPFYGLRRPLLIDLVFLSDAEIEEKYSTLRREAGVVIAETYLPFFRGKEVFLWGKASPIYDEKGKVIGAIESIRDITDAKRVENAVRESERGFREILENIELASIIMDKQGRVIFCNDFLLGVTGWRREELTGADLVEVLVAEESRAETRLVFEEMIGTGKTLAHFENDILTRNAERRTVRWNNTMFRDSLGEIQGVTCIGEDITERKQLERQLLQAQKMEAIGTMAVGIAHDFNNILAAILGYTELSLLGVTETSPLHGHLSQILSSTMRARDLVRQILTFSRQQLELESVPMDLKPVFEETLKFLRATLPATIAIRSHISAQDLIAQINPTQLHQILVNLAANAAHAMRERSGVLVLSLEKVALEAAKAFQHWELEPGPYLRISVADCGHGMDAITMERIFDPYFTTKPVGEGSGLGLSIVHGIVTRHQGAISVTSEPGKGTRFEILIPEADSAPPDQTELEHGKPVTGGTERILVVDDEELLVDLLTQNLTLLGYSVVGTTSSEEALEIFSSNPTQFDLVITDLSMPHLTGLDLAVKMHALTPDIPIILCTGFSESISEETASDLGIQGIMFKPCSRTNLAESIRTVLDRRTGAASSDHQTQ
jgi:PAS domain S-box-containing protein